MRSYRPEELFDAEGRRWRRSAAGARRARAAWAPTRTPTAACSRRRSGSPTSATTRSPWRSRARSGPRTPARSAPSCATSCGGTRATSASSARTRPPRTSSTRSTRSAASSGWPSTSPRTPTARSWRRDGRVVEMLSEHTMEGMLEGYLLTGRHGFLSTYEAFVHVIDSMFNQHAKWLDVCNHLSWREEVASLNLLITSTVWRQDHNGFTHQDPGFLDVVVNKSAAGDADLPAAGRQLPALGGRPLPAQRELRQRHRLGQAAAPAVPRPADAAITHCAKGIGIWDWASTDQGVEPDVVMAAAGDITTLEALAADGAAARGVPGPEDPLRQRGRPLPAAAGHRAPARAVRPRLRRPLHHGQAGDLQLPRLPLADPPAGLPARQPPQPARARLQGEGEHQHPDGAGDQQPDRPLQPRDRRHRPRAAAARRRRPRQGELPQRADRLPAATPTSTAWTRRS